MLQQAIPRYEELSFAEKLQLLEELWDDVSKDPTKIPVPESQVRELESRYQEFLKNPDTGSPWEEVKGRLLTQLR